MSKKNPVGYTLWTKPKEDWTPVLKGIQPSEDIFDAMNRAAMSVDDSAIKEQLKAYDTPVTAETLSQIIE